MCLNIALHKHKEVDIVHTGSYRAVFTRDSIYAIARICHANSVLPSVCLSVRLSATRVYCIKTAERIIQILSLSDRTIILVFF